MSSNFSKVKQSSVFSVRFLIVEYCVLGIRISYLVCSHFVSWVYKMMGKLYSGVVSAGAWT